MSAYRYSHYCSGSCLRTSLRRALVFFALLALPAVATAFSSKDIIATASSSAHLWVMTTQGVVHCSQTSCTPIQGSPKPTQHLSAQGSSLWAVTTNGNSSTPWFCTFSRCTQMPAVEGSFVSVDAASASAWIITSAGVHFCDPNTCQKIAE